MSLLSFGFMLEFLKRNFMSERNWKHRVSDSDDTDSILKLREEVFQDSSFDRKKWNWQYRDNPMGSSYIDLAVDKIEEKKLAGHYAVISYQMLLQGKKTTTAQSLDTFTSGDYRRQGIFVDIAEKCYERAKVNGVTAIFGFPNANSYPGFVKKLSFIDPFGFGIYKLPIKLGYYTSRFPGGALFSNIKINKISTPKTSKLEQIQAIPREYDQLWEAFKETHSFLICRDAEYLKWRYINCPDRKYELYALKRNDKLTALAVVGIDQENKFAHLVDFIYETEDDLEDVLKHVTNHIATTKDINCVDVYLNESNILCASLEKIGFTYTSKSESLRFIVRDLQNDSYSDAIKDSSNWYITAGDTDFY